MKYLRKFNESKEIIESICQRYGITNYNINQDGSIDVNENVYLYFQGLTKLPLKFRNVGGNFHCHNNQLTTLEGAPQTVGGDFHCHDNQLTTLEGGPRTVGGGFDCSNNQLTTLEEGPRTVSSYFNCANNQLTKLEGAPQSVGVSFICSYNKLINLEFAPSCRYLSCTHNPIYKWWSKLDDTSKLDAFINLGIDSRDPDFMNEEKINLLNE